MKNYKAQSRRKTGKIVTGTHGMKKFNINNHCRKCGKIKDLEIHHEIYPVAAEEIKQAITDKKIYYLCKKCHKSTHTK